MCAVPTEARGGIRCLELELQAIVGHLTQVLGTKLRSSRRIVSSLEL